jgi:hypothetical protein
MLCTRPWRAADAGPHTREPQRNHSQSLSTPAHRGLSRLRLLDATLADGREFLCSDRFTVADVNIAYALLLARGVGLEDKLQPQTLEYLRRLTAREGYVRERKRKSEGASAKKVLLLLSPRLARDALPLHPVRERSVRRPIHSLFFCARFVRAGTCEASRRSGGPTRRQELTQS